MMNRVFLPMVAGSNGAKPAFGIAHFGPHQQQHDLMAAGYPLCDWYAYRCCMEYRLYMPYLRRYDYVVPLERIKPMAEQYPGRTWCLWNEPDMPTQDRTPPAEAVGYTRIWCELIGDNGRIAGYGINMQPAYDGGLRWLEGYLDAGGELPDAWHMHIYANDAAQWRDLYLQWQEWNAKHGNLPTIISEAGGNLTESPTSHGWLSIYHYLRQWADERVEAVYWYTDKPADYGIVC